MSTQRARRMLEFFRKNIRSGTESIREAREFVARISTLTRMEREFMDIALRDRKHLDKLCLGCPSVEPRREPIPLLPVATMGPCGLVRPSKEARRLSAG